MNRRTRTRRGVAVDSAPILLGVFLERSFIVVTPPPFPARAGEVRGFAPTPSEAFMVFGLYGPWVLLPALATKMFPIGEMPLGVRGTEA